MLNIRYYTTTSNLITQNQNTMFKKIYITLSICLLSGHASSFNISISSPDDRITLNIIYGRYIRYSLAIDGEEVMKDNHAELELSLAESTILPSPKVKKYVNRKETINSPFYKYPQFNIEYNGCIIEHQKNLSIEFRVFNDGISYRFFTHGLKSKEYKVNNEHCEFNFTKDYTSYIPYSTNPKNPWAMAFQSTYDVKKMSEQNNKNLGFLPITIDVGSDKNKELKLSILESNVEKYPCMFVKVLDHSINGVYDNYPSEFKYYEWRYQKYVTNKKDYISENSGDRNFPWRIISISRKDTEMPLNNLVYALASPNRIGNTSWIHPGKVAWDWWNDWGLTGVDFEAGINMPTYKYFIDFASKYGLEYVILDEGWYAPKSGNMLKTIEEINLPELISYANKRNVKLILWTVFNVLDKDLDAACKKYSEMGISGFKVDFLDRNDQEGVEMVYRIAETCAKYKLLLDLHGIYPPTGLNRTYPNILNFESVFGMEESKWTEPNTKDMPLYDVTFPFIRLQCGPVDFTPGGMRNATRKDYKPIYYNPMTMGTRCHQMAMYIIHDSPLTMLADSPTAYEKEPYFTTTLSQIPVIYDDTKILDGKLGEYIVTARRKGHDWYVAGQTNWEPYNLYLSLDFLEDSHIYTAEIFKDGKNANKNGSDYIHQTEKINNQSQLQIPMASGGGFVMILHEEKPISK